MKLEDIKTDTQISENYKMNRLFEFLGEFRMLLQASRLDDFNGFPIDFVESKEKEVSEFINLCAPCYLYNAGQVERVR